MELVQKKCKPCEGGTPPLTKAEIEKLLPKIEGWKLVEGKLQKTWKFKNFLEAGAWLDKVRVLAEAEGHHPDIHWYWNKITLELVTHAIRGLSENDFIMAAKINKLSL